MLNLFICFLTNKIHNIHSNNATVITILTFAIETFLSEMLSLEMRIQTFLVGGFYADKPFKNNIFICLQNDCFEFIS